MSRADCGCLVEDGMTLHGYDGPCAYEDAQPSEEDYCAADNHAYYGDDGEVGRCYCGTMVYPKGNDGDH